MASLRNLLEPARAPIDVEHRTVPATKALGIHEVVDLADLLAWFQGAFGELYATLAAQALRPIGSERGPFSSELFQHERGEAIVFVPFDGDFRPIGRVESLLIPEAELAVTVHHGPHTDIDITYGALGTYVGQTRIGGWTALSGSTTPSTPVQPTIPRSGARRSAGRYSKLRPGLLVDERCCDSSYGDL